MKHGRASLFLFVSLSACQTPSTNVMHPIAEPPDLGPPADLTPPPDLEKPPAPLVDVLTQHNDNSRSGANLLETQLTPEVVKNGFGKLFSVAVDDQVYAQPLIVTQLAVTGKGTRDVLFVATVNNSLYAFDADDGTPLYHVDLGLATGGTPVTNADVGQACGDYQDFSGNIGIVGTPVIDRQTGTLYLVARTKELGGFVQRLHAIAIADGTERPSSPIVIDAVVTGTGDDTDASGQIAFNPTTQNQRLALTLTGGTVIIGWSSHCDTHPYHGWVLAYDAQSLAQVGVFNDTPNGGGGGIWQAGGGPVVDAQGDLIVATGNGDFDGLTNFSQTMVKLAPRTLTLLDWFTPSEWDAMNGVDADFGSCGSILIPGTDYIASGSKTGELFISHASSLGNIVDKDIQIIEKMLADRAVNATNHLHGGPVYWRGPSGNLLYVMGESDFLRAYKLDGKTFDLDAAFVSTVKPPDGMPGGMLALSANDNRDGVVWAAHPSDGDANNAVRHGVLRAFDASDVTKELWNSLQTPEDDFGKFAKFVSPTVANGKVYMATFSQQVFVYGALAASHSP
jgi:hypothetical protein